MRLSFVLAASLLLSGCHKSNDPEPIGSEGSDLVAEAGCGTPGPAGYRVLLRTQLRAVQLPGTVETFLLSKDNGVYSSGGAKLIASLVRQDDVISLRYCGVIDEGLTAVISSAQSAVSLQDLPPQVYRLRITVRNRHTTGTLDLTTTPARLRVADTTVAAPWR